VLKTTDCFGFVVLPSQAYLLYMRININKGRSVWITVVVLSEKWQILEGLGHHIEVKLWNLICIKEARTDGCTRLTYRTSVRLLILLIFPQFWIVSLEFLGYFYLQQLMSTNV